MAASCPTQAKERLEWATSPAGVSLNTLEGVVPYKVPVAFWISPAQGNIPSAQFIKEQNS
jgi:hypothetical protein